MQKKVIVTKRFILEPNLFRPHLKPNKFAFFNLTNYHDLKLTMANKKLCWGQNSAKYLPSTYVQTKLSQPSKYTHTRLPLFSLLTAR